MRLWCGIMLTACWSGAAAAQTSPFRDLNLFVGGVLTYDDNIFRTPDGVTRAGNQHRSDWIFEPTVSATYTRPLSLGQISLHGSTSYRFYKRNSQLNRENLDFGVNANDRVWRCDVNGDVSFARAQSDLADLIDGGTLVNAQNSLTVGGGVLCGQNGLRPGFQYSHQIVTNSSTLRQISNHQRDSYRVQIGWERPALGRISIYGSIVDGSYPNRPALGPGLPANDEIRTYSAGLSYNREIGVRLKGSVSVGYMKVKPRLKLVPGSKGITFAGNLTFRGSDRISGGLSFSRGSHESNLLGVDYSVNTQLRTTVTYRLSEVVTLNGTAAWTRRQFKTTGLTSGAFDPTGASVILIGRKDSTKEFGLGATFQSFQRLRFALQGTHTERSSGAGGFDYSANRISLTAGLRF